MENSSWDITYFAQLGKSFVMEIAQKHRNGYIHIV